MSTLLRGALFVSLVGFVFMIGGAHPAVAQCSCGWPCDETISGWVWSASEDVTACNTITVIDSSILSGQTVTLTAGKSIIFGNGFSVNVGGMLVTQISPTLQCDPATDVDQDQWNQCEDCDDAASTCGGDCSDTDIDSRPDCRDLCLDADGDDYGTTTTADQCTVDGSVGCDIGPACLGTDCDDANSSVHPSGVEACNGIDDDCNPTTADGADEPWAGSLCDGADSDLCAEDIFSCSGGMQTCNDTTGDTLDLCNGQDDDCNSATADGADELWLGSLCDGADSDLCAEDIFSCSGGLQTCNDTTGDTLDLCNGQDDDCDPSSADGAEDPLNGAACDGPDSDLCLEGVYSCAGGALSCSDATGSTGEICNGVDDDCDGSVDEGFVRNDNPLCTAGQFNLGSVSGDTASSSLNDSYYNEEWDRFTVTEDNNGIVYLSATISLYSPPGVDYDLYVYCESCGGTLAGSSIIGGLTGHTDTVTVRRDDSWGATDDFDVIVEVRHFSSNICAYWQLTVQGDTTANSETCP